MKSKHERQTEQTPEDDSFHKKVCSLVSLEIITFLKAVMTAKHRDKCMVPKRDFAFLNIRSQSQRFRRHRHVDEDAILVYNIFKIVCRMIGNLNENKLNNIREHNIVVDHQ